MRQLTYAQAIHEALDLALSRDPSVFIIGEGVPDPKGVFGTTTGLQEKYGEQRVMDMPVSENGMTGICIGAAIAGMKPVLVHARVDFSLYSFDQIANTAAKWWYMFGRKQSVPIVIRMIIGRGWGQGAQHSQSLQALFAHIPGLKVVMPASPADAKGLLLASIEDPNPVIFIEHRWLHGISGDVPKGYYTEQIGTSRLVRKGKDVTLVAISHMAVEALRAVQILEEEGISCELIDLRSVAPYDRLAIINSAKKTKRLLVADTAVSRVGFSAEIIASVVESGVQLVSPPIRLTLPNIPTPTSWKLAEHYYPTYLDIVERAMEMMGKKKPAIERAVEKNKPEKNIRSDVPDPSFTGPF